MFKPRTVGFIIALIVFIILLFQNTQVVSIKFFFWQISMSRIILVPLLMSVGFIIGFIVGRRSWDW